MIVVVDYGMGNLSSVRNMFHKAGAVAEISADPAIVGAASRLVLPGVGAFDHGMGNLVERGLLPALNDAVLKRRVPTLGICLGMQLMSRGSEEGQRSGLCWLAADTIRFAFPADSATRRIPHMGWNSTVKHGESFLTAHLPPNPRFYFVHSYHVRCDDDVDVALTTNYGMDVVAAVVRGNIAGTQFHPEKSHRFGLELIRAFVKWSPSATAGTPQ